MSIQLYSGLKRSIATCKSYRHSQVSQKGDKTHALSIFSDGRVGRYPRIFQNAWQITSLSSATNSYLELRTEGSCCNWIDRCLASLDRALPGTPVAIREHSPDSDAVHRLRSLAARQARPIRLDVDVDNPGFGAGCNALARTSEAKWLLFLNPDAEIVTWPWTA